MVAVAQLVESRIVIPVVVGSSPISHPIISFQKTSSFIYLNPVDINRPSNALPVPEKMPVTGRTSDTLKCICIGAGGCQQPVLDLVGITEGTTWHKSVGLM